jgi:lysozyme
MQMKMSQLGLDLLKHYEGMRLTAYQDSVGIWTIGVGHIKGVHKGMVITEQQSDDFLREDLEEAEDAVNRLVTVPLDQAQFDALASLVFNIGQGNFSHSTLLKKLNAHDYLGASAQFCVWNRAGGKPVLGLTRRRAAERDLFLRG